MTICVCVKARDGVVLGTDSMTQVHLKTPDGQLGVAKTYSNARKLFELKGQRVGVMTYGAGNLGPRTIFGLVLDFSRDASEKSVEVLANNLYAFIEPKYRESVKDVPEGQRPGLGFYMAGYSGTEALAEEWEFVFPRDKGPMKVRPEGAFGASWRGVEMPFTRLHFGFDPRMPDLLHNAGVSDEVLAPIFKETAFRSPVAFEGMPIQDAINFAVYVLRTTIGFTSFELGPSSCGGPLQIATITHHGGFEWVREPKYRIEEDTNG